MARRFSSSIKYGRRPLLDRWKAVTFPGVEELKLTALQSLRLRSVTRLGRRIRRNRDRIVELESAISEDGGRVRKLLEPFRKKGIAGVVSHRGKKPFRTMLVERTGFEVGNNRAFYDWLVRGDDDVTKVIKSCVIKPTSVEDPQQLLRFLSLVARHFPNQFDQMFELQFDLKELNKVIEKRDERPPAGVIVEKAPTDFVLAEHKA